MLQLLKDETFINRLLFLRSMSSQPVIIGAAAMLMTLISYEQINLVKPPQHFLKLPGVELSQPTISYFEGMYDIDFLCRPGVSDALLYIDRNNPSEITLRLNLHTNLEETIDYNDGSVITIPSKETTDKIVAPSTEVTLVQDLNLLLSGVRTKFCNPDFYDQTEKWIALNSGSPCPDPAFPKAKSCFYALSGSYTK